MESSSQEAVYLDFLIRDSLQKIADDLKTEFPIPIIEQYQLINTFILNLLSSDEIFHNLTYLKLEEKFYTTIIETPNKEVFVNLEKKSILHLVEDSISPLPEKSKIYEQIVSMFLIAKEKEHVIKMYFNKYLLDSDYISFVCICAGYDLIKYMVFLESDRVKQLINEPLPIKDMPGGKKIENKKTKTKPIADLTESDKTNSAKTDYSEEKIFKVSDFLPLYGYLWGDDYTLTIKGVVYSMNDLFEDQDIEISDIQLGWLRDYDRTSFISRLSHLQPENYIIEFLRDTLDEYISEAGDPVYWIIQTIDDIELNYIHYPAVHRGMILKHLMEWLEYYLKANKVFVKDIPNDSDDSVADTTQQPPSKSIPMKAYLSESAKEYIIKYETRLNQFVSELEATEMDFIEKESDFWENCIYDLQNSEASHDGFSRIGIEIYEILYELVMQIGYDKFNYSTKRKMEFLTERKINLIPQPDVKAIKSESKKEQPKEDSPVPKTLQDIFINPKNMQPCIDLLMDLSPPVINAHNNYIGKAKGIFPLWIRILLSHKPNPIIKTNSDKIYKDLLNKTFPGLNLSKDASEFRKSYKRLEDNKIDIEIKTLLSQLSHEGKLGK